MVNWESQSKTPPQSPEDGHIYCILLIRIACLKTCHFTVCLTSPWTSVSVFYVNTACDVVTVVLIFVEYLSLYIQIFTCTYRGTHTQEHMYNQNTTRGMATTRHRPGSLVERGRRKAFVRDKDLAYKKKQEGKKVRKHPIFTNLKKKIRAHGASSKATRLFLMK